MTPYILALIYFQLVVLAAKDAALDVVLEALEDPYDGVKHRAAITKIKEAR